MRPDWAQQPAFLSFPRKLESSVASKVNWMPTFRGHDKTRDD
jgi:hypothetical protein